MQRKKIVITQTDMQILEFLRYCKSYVTIRDLRRVLGLPTSTVYSAVKRLAELGLVKIIWVKDGKRKLLAVECQ